MTRPATIALLCATLGALPLAAAAQDDPGGTLNPDEMGLNRMVEDIREGRTGMTQCAAGYMMTKSGRHGAARETFRRCAEDGYTGAMTWMGQLDDNGLGGAYDPDAAAEWDRRAAEAGDPVGMLNTGLNLLRGRGVAQDEALGRSYVDAAAAAGVAMARRLQAAGYDPEEVTPDADNWKHAPLF